MLPDLPTLLVKPQPILAQKLLHMVRTIKPHYGSIRKQFAEYYLYIQRSKVSSCAIKQKSKFFLQLQKEYEMNGLTGQEMFLQDCINRELTWFQIAQNFQMDLRVIRKEWHYQYYLILEIMRRLPSTLSIFLSIKLFGKSWQTAENALNLIKQCSVVKKRVNKYISYDLKALRVIQNSFLKNLLIAIKMERTVEGVLKCINYQALLENKNDNIDLMPDEWSSFLCSRFSSNKKEERPIIKFSQNNFIIKWGRLKKMSLDITKAFQDKLRYIMTNVQNFNDAFLSQIDVTLLRGLRQKWSWLEVKTEIFKQINLMNTFEGNFYLQHPKQEGRLNKTVFQGRLGSNSGEQQLNTTKSENRNKEKQRETSFISNIEGEFKRKNQKKPVSMYCPPQFLKYSKVHQSIHLEQDQDLQPITLSNDQQELLYFLTQLKNEIKQIENQQLTHFNEYQLKRYYKTNDLQNKFQPMLNLYQNANELATQINHEGLKKIISSLLIMKKQNSESILFGNRLNKSLMGPYSIKVEDSNNTDMSQDRINSKRLSTINNFVRKIQPGMSKRVNCQLQI